MSADTSTSGIDAYCLRSVPEIVCDVGGDTSSLFNTLAVAEHMISDLVWKPDNDPKWSVVFNDEEISPHYKGS
jgi:hypothetical protein